MRSEKDIMNATFIRVSMWKVTTSIDKKEIKLPSCFGIENN
jgi:hypothetical protein